MPIIKNVLVATLLIVSVNFSNVQNVHAYAMTQSEAQLMNALTKLLELLQRQLNLVQTGDMRYPDEGTVICSIAKDNIETVQGEEEIGDDNTYIYTNQCGNYLTRVFENTPKSMNLNRVEGFIYDPSFEYSIVVEQRRGAGYYDEDTWKYDYNLIEIVSKREIQ